ncbi:cell division protein FtsZ [Apibacter adventoris]|uniref:Cell division protein FtsZ n=1 Tax=Apibacter adventoris TaxID=1679466 RepID=A0A0H4Q3X3_9FLAO|nr:cell division protein FtsZ [Apibacter adventoris]AKP61314.1 cell division protein FtsZ [Apibacter adventoris]PQL95769.1 cell division protein FtsZ [Apibacter adventoris]
MDNTNNKLFFELPKNRPSAIKVIGVGGGGNNAVGYMYDQGITGVDFIICNTDAQALVNNPIPNKIQLGTTITEGLGAGANPEIGEQAALESIDDIKSALGEDTKMVFITAGMGGGTGTGAAPIIAGIAKEMGILTVGIVTIPFSFEGKSRLEQAEKGLEKIRRNVDSLIVVKNDKLRELYGNLGYKSGFSKSNEVLSTAAKGIAEVITKNYSINIDLRDARTVLADSGTAIMGSSIASGPNKAQDAIMAALDSPLLNDNKISGAKNVLLLIVSGDDEITVDEIGIINDHIQSESGNNTNIIMGIGEDENLGENISVTVIATGFPIDDERNSGKEKEKIIHTLSDEPVFPNTMNIGGKTASTITREKDNEEPQITSFTLQPEAEDKKEFHSQPITPQKIITLEEEEEIISYGISNKPEQITSKIELDEEITLIKKDRINQETENHAKSFVSKEDPLQEEIKSEKEIAVNQTSIFNLDEIDNFTQKVTVTDENSSTEKNPVSSEEDIFKYEKNTIPPDINITTSEINEENIEALNDLMEKKIKERRERLKKLNSKFQNLSKQNVDEVEKIPAYLRQGVDLDEKKNADNESNVYFNKKSNEIQIRPNNFFHDNVD